LGAGHVSFKDHNSNSGMIDPQTGLLAWIRPVNNWTVGLEYWLYAPFGSNELSGHSLDHSVALVTNYTVGNLTFDGDVAVKIRGDYRHSGVSAEQGDTLFTNLSLSYKFMRNIEPLVKLDYQSTGAGKNKDTGARINSSDELAIGIGNHFSLTDKLSADVWYLKGVEGRNTTKTNSVYLKFCYLF
ncbi:MAG: transporter, partial [Desulfuromonadales bacterium]|nr:transporter [Desulfuromonadales bacterium]